MTLKIKCSKWLLLIVGFALDACIACQANLIHKDLDDDVLDVDVSVERIYQQLGVLNTKRQ